jgi:hypothetical protein
MTICQIATVRALRRPEDELMPGTAAETAVRGRAFPPGRPRSVVLIRVRSVPVHRPAPPARSR